MNLRTQGQHSIWLRQSGVGCRKVSWEPPFGGNMERGFVPIHPNVREDGSQARCINNRNYDALSPH